MPVIKKIFSGFFENLQFLRVLSLPSHTKFIEEFNMGVDMFIKSFLCLMVLVFFATSCKQSESGSSVVSSNIGTRSIAAGSTEGVKEEQGEVKLTTDQCLIPAVTRVYFQDCHVNLNLTTKVKIKFQIRPQPNITNMVVGVAGDDLAPLGFADLAVASRVFQTGSGLEIQYKDGGDAYRFLANFSAGKTYNVIYDLDLEARKASLSYETTDRTEYYAASEIDFRPTASINQLVRLMSWSITDAESLVGNAEVVYSVDDLQGNSSNVAPEVEILNGSSISSPQSSQLILDGSVTDPGDTYSTLWSKVSGPGQVTFLSALEEDTEVSFSALGSYVLKLEATDSQGETGSALITISVSSSGGGSLGNRPGPTSTGPNNPSLLSPLSGYDPDASNVTYENFTWTGGQLSVRADNVTFKNCKIDGGYRSGSSGTSYAVKVTGSATFEDCEIFGARSSVIYVQDGSFVGKRLYIHDGGADLIKYQGSNNTSFLLEDSWGRFGGLKSGSHADFLQMRRGSNLTLRGNYCDFPTPYINSTGQASANFPSTYPGAPLGTGTSSIKANACAIVEAADGNISNVLIEDNWLNGGNYTLYLYEEWCLNGVAQNGSYGCNGTFQYFLDNVTVRNNKFGDDYNWGIISTTSGFSMTAYGNVWDTIATFHTPGDPVPGL